MTLTDEEIRVKVAELMGFRWVKGTYVGLSACPPAYKQRLFFLDDASNTCDWEFSETEEVGQMNAVQIAGLPDYLNDPASALLLCDRMHSEGWSYTITRYPERTEHLVTFGKPEHEGHHASDPSLARAVTLCFLKCHE